MKEPKNRLILTRESLQSLYTGVVHLNRSGVTYRQLALWFDEKKDVFIRLDPWSMMFFLEEIKRAFLYAEATNAFDMEKDKNTCLNMILPCALYVAAYTGQQSFARFFGQTPGKVNQRGIPPALCVGLQMSLDLSCVSGEKNEFKQMDGDHWLTMCKICEEEI